MYPGGCERLDWAGQRSRKDILPTPRGSERRASGSTATSRTAERSSTAGRTSQPTTIHACSWGSSLYAAQLAHLEPEKITGLLLGGVPDDELRYLTSGRKIPDPLLHAGLFAELTVAELVAGLAQSVILDPETCR